MTMTLQSNVCGNIRKMFHCTTHHAKSSKAVERTEFENSRCSKSGPRVVCLKTEKFEFYYVEENKETKPTRLWLHGHGINLFPKRVVPVAEDSTITYMCPHNRLLLTVGIQYPLAHNPDNIAYARVGNASARLVAPCSSEVTRKDLAGTEKVGYVADLDISRFQYSKKTSREGVNWREKIESNLEALKNEFSESRDKVEIINCIQKLLESRDRIAVNEVESLYEINDMMMSELGKLKNLNLSERQELQPNNQDVRFQDAECDARCREYQRELRELKYLLQYYKIILIKLDIELLHQQQKRADRSEIGAIKYMLLKRHKLGQEPLVMVLPKEGKISRVSKVLPAAKQAGFEPTDLVVGVCRARGRPFKSSPSFLPAFLEKYYNVS